MAKKINVLIFPAGSEIAHDLYDSLRYNLHVEVFGASGKPDDARFLYDANHYIEADLYVTKQDFIQKFNKILAEKKIDVIMPTHDTIALYLAEHQSKINAKVLTSRYETALVAREKRRTYDLFKDADICPIVYEELFDDLQFPVFLKPNIGEGAKRTVKCESKEEALHNLEQAPDLLICEYLPGEELSVDCFTDRHGKMLFVGPRTRERVQMGISFHSASVPLTEEIKAIAETINEKVEIRGAWFFQIKKDVHGKYRLLEFAVRQASTMGLYRQVGINFALLSLFDILDQDVSVLQNQYSIELERSLYNRYKHHFDYQTVYIDFDDCIVVNDTVNEVAMRFLYACQRRQKKVILITKHRYDIKETLSKYRIHEDLFNEIVTLEDNDDKAKFIKPTDAIFIDNYFWDRKAVKDTLGIPVFDVDAIESLL